MKNFRSLPFFVLVISIAILSACPITTNDANGDSDTEKADDPIAISAGAWASVSVSVGEQSGATDETFFAAEVAAKDTYIVECQNLSPGISADDISWSVYRKNTSPICEGRGQRAADAVVLAVGTYSVAVRNNNADFPLKCEIRLVPLNASNIYIPSEGSIDSPLALRVEELHAGKVGNPPADEGYSDSYYTFDADQVGDYRISVFAGTDSALYINLYSDADFITPRKYAFADATKNATIVQSVPQAGTQYYVKVSDWMSSAEKPNYIITVSRP